MTEYQILRICDTYPKNGNFVIYYICIQKMITGGDVNFVALNSSNIAVTAGFNSVGI